MKEIFQYDVAILLYITHKQVSHIEESIKRLANQNPDLNIIELIHNGKSDLSNKKMK